MILDALIIVTFCLSSNNSKVLYFVCWLDAVVRWNYGDANVKSPIFIVLHYILFLLNER